VIDRFRQHWQDFKASKPGYRFQDRYRRHRQSGHGRFGFRRILNIVVGSVLAIVSAFFGWAPGPGLITFFIGLGLIAGELLFVARFLDWAEVRVRKLAHPVIDVWKRSSPVVKALMVLAVLACAAALGYGAYYLIFSSQLLPSLF
jgi:hypothetical protein